MLINALFDRSAPDLGGASRGDLSGHGGPPTQSAPVNLTISDRNVRYGVR